MRFAYIDSQGNEVAIPSVDALALRIELGAIKPDTELYDAQADRWGPASTHEIFHTLSRAAEDDTFVVPPPPVAPPPPPPPPPPPVVESVAPPAVEETSVEELAPEVSDVSVPSELSDSSAEPTFAAEDEAAGDSPTDPGEYSFDLVDDGPAEPSPSAKESAADQEIESGLGDLGGELELEQTEDVSTPAASDPSAPDPTGGLELERSLAGDTAGEDASDLGGGLDLETEMDFLGGGPVDSGFGDGLDLEEPMSGSASDAPPAWMEQDGPAKAGDESVMEFSASSTDAEAPGGAAPVRERRQPRSRPSAPRPIKRRSGPGPLVALLVVVVLGVGGYYGWQAFAAREAAPPPRPAVVIPQIPAELVPQMRDLAAVALRETFDDIDAQTADEGAPSEPREEWLAGVYLANASRFSDVEVFWVNMSRFTEMMRDTETTVFHEKYLEQAESAELDSPVVVQLTERADSGFVATREERLRQYAMLSTLADAALELHDFLVENETNIEHTPATGLSGNPVEEAVPNSQELSDRMWSMVEALTNAQDALLGTLDRVNRELLISTIRARIEQIGIS